MAHKREKARAAILQLLLRPVAWEENRLGEKVRQTGFGTLLVLTAVLEFECFFIFQTKNVILMPIIYTIITIILYNYYYYNLYPQILLTWQKRARNFVQMTFQCPQPVISGKFDRYSWATWFSRFQNLYLILLQAPLIMWGRNMASQLILLKGGNFFKTSIVSIRDHQSQL